MRKIIAMAALPLMFASTAAMAQDEDTEEATGAWEVDGEIGINSDYRFRGISLSDKDPEVTAELSVSHESGLYAGVWASNVALDDGADDLELDLYAGYAADVGAISIDVGAVYYLYPDFSDYNYVELLGSIGTAVGPGTVTLGVAYAPSQENLGDEDNTYVYISGEMPIGDSPISVHGTFGIEDGAFADNKKDWLIGASYDLGSGFTATLDYVDTAHSFTSLGDATVVAGLSFAF
ncbi:TorF family putative porin [Qipengyuania sp. RANM35]|uniref:TorF family putative porin n=1 Tax=Qipengyuania sp. RANM35 TaxID=3068635 RepID=UPI0034DB5519